MGETDDPSTYRAWKQMIRLCYVPAQTGYAELGGRGVGVCKPWRASFENFLRDMGPCGGQSLQRKDRKQGFNKFNCHWGT